MNSFAEYILSEEDLASKMEITYYLSKKVKIFFDKSVVYKTELLKMFLQYSKIEVDENLLLTASLLCNCKKMDNIKDKEEIYSYAKVGAEYLSSIGFEERFTKICQEVNRYSKSEPREKESDLLELVDQFGGMLLDRPERIGFKPDEALVLLEHRNLKDCYNAYLTQFIEFINFLESIPNNECPTMTVLRRITKMYNETEELTKFIQKVIYEFEPEVANIFEKYTENMEKIGRKVTNNPNRPLFSEETTKKIMNHINEKVLTNPKDEKRT